MFQKVRGNSIDCTYILGMHIIDIHFLINPNTLLFPFIFCIDQRLLSHSFLPRVSVQTFPVRALPSKLYTMRQ